MSQNLFEHEIPPDRNRRVLSKAQLRSDEEVIIFVDQGVLRKGAAGIVFTDKGIHKYGLFSHRFFPYAEVKTLSLTVGQVFCNLFVVSSSQGGHPLGGIPPRDHPTLFRLLSPYIANIEADKPDPEVRLELVKKGLFSCRIDRWDEIFRDARCYLVYPLEKTIVRVKDAGIDFGQMTMFKALGGRGFHRGVTPVDLAVSSATSEYADLFVPWEQIHGFAKELVLDLIPKETENEKFDREKRSAYVFFHNEKREREEWLRLELFSIQERDLFLDIVKTFAKEVDLKR
jgi:hypothetical protein